MPRQFIISTRMEGELMNQSETLFANAQKVIPGRRKLSC